MEFVNVIESMTFIPNPRRITSIDETIKTRIEKAEVRYHQDSLIQELKTLLHISSNEGRECGSSAKQRVKRLRYDCGHSDWIVGRSSLSVIPRNNSAGFVTWIS